MKKYDVDRKTASEFLNVSTRTLDRYIKANKLSSRVMSGRVWLSMEELEQVKHSRQSRQDVDKTKVSTSHMSIDKKVLSDPEASTVRILSRHKVDNVDRSRQGKSQKKIDPHENNFLEIIKQTQKELEKTKYEIGKLESQLQNSIPVSVHYQHMQSQKEYENKLKIQLAESEFYTRKVRIELKFQKIVKWVLLWIIICILILQPLWLLAFY